MSITTFFLQLMDHVGGNPQVGATRLENRVQLPHPRSRQAVPVSILTDQPKEKDTRARGQDEVESMSLSICCAC